MNRVTAGIASAVMTGAMIVSFAAPAAAQNRGNFYRGARSQHPYNNNYDRGYHGHDNDRGGIGPGTGALIGAAGGVALGALFGGGLQQALVGGLAGAGVGAIAGKVNQDSHDYRDHRR